jgi:hypothetical protein
VSENEVVHAVSMVTFEMSISDNNELSQAIVRIEPDIDLDGFFEWTEGDWTSFKLFDLGGNNVNQVFKGLKILVDLEYMPDKKVKEYIGELKST